METPGSRDMDINMDTIFQILWIYIPSFINDLLSIFYTAQSLQKDFGFNGYII